MAISNRDIHDAAIQKVADRKFGYDLYFIEHDERLTIEQVESLVHGKTDDLYMDVTEARSEGAYINAIEEVKDLAKEVIAELARDDEDVDEDDVWWEFEYSPQFDEVRFAVQDRDESDPVRDLAGNAPDPLVQYVPDMPIEITVEHVDGGYDTGEVHAALKDIGLPVTPHNVQALSESLNECHDYASIRAIFTVDLAELLDTSIKWLRVKAPRLLCLNNFDGSGMDTEPMEGTIMVPRDQIRLDSALGYGSWDEIAGVVVSAYTTDIEYVRLCEYEFDGTDTDGTDFYRCTSHGSSEPSYEAHCGKATEPAYAMLVTGKEGQA